MTRYGAKGVILHLAGTVLMIMLEEFDRLGKMTPMVETSSRSWYGITGSFHQISMRQMNVFDVYPGG